MATIVKIVLSGSTNGRPVQVVAAAATGTLIHTAQSSTGANSMDEIWLYAGNTASGNKKLVVEFGGTSTSDHIEVTVPAEDGMYLVSPGLVLRAGLAVRAYATATAGYVNIGGYVNQLAS